MKRQKVILSENVVCCTLKCKHTVQAPASSEAVRKILVGYVLLQSEYSMINN